jgi:tagatose-1,6-bisphosphate aldolase
MNLDSLELSKTQKATLFKLLAQDPDIEADVQTWFDSMLIKSELKPIKRIAELEAVTGLNDYSDFDEDEREPNIPEQIEALKEEIVQHGFIPTEKPVVIKEPTNDTEHRATLLVRALEDSGKNYFSTKEIIDFLKCKLPDYCKIKDKTKNIWKVKQDVIKTATEMFPNVDFDKKKYGHKDVRLVLKSHNPI